MKTNFIRLFAVVSLFSVISCGNDKAKEAETKAAEEAAVAKATAIDYKVATDASSIAWTGFKPTGSHNGTISISDGKMSVLDGTIESGEFNIAMNSIEVKDIPKEEDDNAKLKGHLTSADFFDVEKFPKANFVVTKIAKDGEQVMLSGNLTLKGVSNNVTFPVTVSSEGDTMTLTSEKFTIDRSKWNVKYGSKSFFKDLGDKFINDDIELQVTLKAIKA